MFVELSHISKCCLFYVEFKILMRFSFFPQDSSPAHRRHVKMVACVFHLHDRIHAASEYTFWFFNDFFTPRTDFSKSKICNKIVMKAHWTHLMLTTTFGLGSNTCVPWELYRYLKTLTLKRSLVFFPIQLCTIRFKLAIIQIKKKMAPFGVFISICC